MIVKWSTNELKTVLTATWDTVAGAEGFTFWKDGLRVSYTMDPTRTFTRFGLDGNAHIFEIKAHKQFDSAKTAYPLPTTPPAPAGFPKHGVAWSWFRDATYTQELGLIGQLGVKAVRLDFSWKAHEPSQGSFTKAMGKVVADLASRGIQILGTVSNTPAWANGGSTQDKTPPTDQHIPDFAAYTARCATAYPEVGAWEIWNEPNAGWFWVNAPYDPDRYTRILAPCRDAIRATGSKAVVVSAGLAPHGGVGTKDGSGWNPVDYFRGMVSAGALDHVDAIGDHPYWPVEGPGSPWDLLTNPTYGLRKQAADAGHADLPFWLTETGCKTAWVGGDEAKQAATVKPILDAAAALPYVETVFWFTLGDYVDPGFGLFRSDWSVRPAVAAFKAVA